MLEIGKLLNHIIENYKQLRVFRPENCFLLPTIL